MSTADDLSRATIKSRNMEEIIAGSFDEFPRMCSCKSGNDMFAYLVTYRPRHQATKFLFAFPSWPNLNQSRKFASRWFLPSAKDFYEVQHIKNPR